MKLVCRTARLATPQTTQRGAVRKNINGEPIYTEYLRLSADREQDVRQHMRYFIDIISDFSDEEFSILTDKVDISEKTQIDNEPKAYSFLERLDFVLKRLESTDDLTTGIIDMYNHVIGKTMNALDFEPFSIESARIKIEDPDTRRMRNKLDPVMFGLGDE